MSPSKLAALLTEVDLAIEDATRDYPDVNPDDVAHDVAESMSWGYPPAVRQAIRRHVGLS